MDMTGGKIMRQNAKLPLLGTVPVRLTAMLLAVDAVLIGLFLLWAYAAHHQASDMWIYGRSLFSMGEGELNEQWGFMKLAVAAVLTAMIAWPRRQLFFWGLCALLIAMLLSDALELHERINAAVSALTAGRVGAIYIDPITKLALAGGPLALMTYGLWARPAAERAAMIRLAAPTLLLGGWSAAVDLLHAIYAATFGGNETIATLIEEGGEGVLITLIVACLAGYRMQQRRRNDPAALPAT
jgi:hypothetical protein